MKLIESLTIHKSNLSTDQMASLMKLIEEYDIFALDPTDLGCIHLVTHSIDTGDSPPIHQPMKCVYMLNRTIGAANDGTG